MKSFVSLLVLLLPCFLFAQESRRVAVPGTHCTIIPPAYFLPAEGFAGFTAAEKEVFVEAQLQSRSNQKIELTSMRPVTIPYMDGFELLGRGTTAGKPAVLHMTVLFQDDGRAHLYHAWHCQCPSHILG